MRYQQSSDLTDIHYSDFLAPKWWSTWLAIFIIKATGRLPKVFQVLLGWFIGSLTYLIAGSRKRVARCNIEAAFPELSPAEKQKLLFSIFLSSGLAITETARSWSRKPQKLSDFTIEGLEHIEKAKQEKRGVIMLGGHFSPMDIVGSKVGTFIDFDQVQRKHDNPLFNLYMTRARKGYSANAIARQDMRTLIRSLKDGRVVWYAPDQDLGAKASVFVPFFGIPTATITMTSKLAKAGNALVIPIHFYREGPFRYHAKLHAPLDIPSDSLEADAACISAWIEDKVRQNPEQYLWLHRRFKTRPEGEKSIY